jgi:predicted amidophosphoribosyltransferase
MRNFTKSLLSIIYSQKCIYCAKFGSYICERCKWQIGSTTFKYQTLDTTIFAGTNYSRELARLVLAAKEDHDRSARQVLVQLLESALRLALKSNELMKVNAAKSSFIYLIPIPSRDSANRVRGFKHSLLLAELLAINFATSKIIVIDCLKLSKRIRDQAGLGLSARKKNMAGAYTLQFKEPQRIYEQILQVGNQEVYILDDLVTTGATTAAAKLALANGKITISGVLAACATTGVYALR